jgi:hypothetical protein
MKSKIVTPLLFHLISLMVISGCKEEHPAIYDSSLTAVYFPGMTVNDSITYSFVGKHAPDTVFVPVKILGNTQPTDMKYKVVVSPEKTTAKEGIHYEKLKDYYTIPKGAFTARLPIILYRTDPALSSKYFSLSLTLVDSEEMPTGYPIYLNARISFTNQLIQPSYWSGILQLYFGDYSKVKHAKCIEIMGHDFPLTQAGMLASPYKTYSYWMSMGRVASKYFSDNVVNDENGNRILPWSSY